MLPRHLRAVDPGGPKHELPATHRPEAAGTVAALVSAATSSDDALEKFADAAGHGGVRPRPVPAVGDETDADEVVPRARCPQMEFVGARGRVPNLYWHAPDESQLRRHPRFRGLPPTDAVTLGSEASFRFVRQGTALWDDLHAGRLTTGCLTGALGFQEDGVHRSLGMGGRGGSHGPMLGAYHRLRQTPLAFVAEADGAAADRANEATVREYNDQQDALGPLLPEAAGGEKTACVFGANGDSRVAAPRRAGAGGAKKKKKKKPRRDAGDGERSEETRNVFSELVPNAPWLARRDPHSRAAAQRGDGGVRMAWGSAQEHGTVATLMLRHPDAVAEEVGLCMVDAAALPRDLNPGPLPPMGASPDGIITMDTSAWFVGNDGDDGDSTGAAPRRERLVVEVKNSSPFRKGPGGGSAAKFEVTDRDPFASPPAYHMPQLQMEMLAANTEAGLLCMQSATRGVRVFYVRRDDRYIAAMLGILSDFFVHYVRTGVPPPERAFNARRDHQALVRATRRVAASCVLVEEIAHARLPGEAYDPRPFV